MNFSFRDLLREATQPATLRAIPFILFGCFIAAVALVYFINPYGIVPGGAFGASIVIHAIFPSMPIGTLGLMIQIPLMLISMLVLGGRLGVRTIVAAISLPLFVNLLTTLSYPAGEAMRTLDPKLLLGGHLDLTNDLIVSSLIGGVLLGAGTGLVIRQQASSGGSDIVAMILNKYSGLPFSYCLMIVDGTIVLSGLLVIGMGLGLNVGSAEPRSWMLSFYSLITMFAIARSIGVVVSGTTDAKTGTHHLHARGRARAARVDSQLARPYGDALSVLWLVQRARERNLVAGGAPKRVAGHHRRCEGTGARLLCCRDRRLRCLRLSLESTSRCECTADSLSDECGRFLCFDALYIDFPARPFAVGRSGRLAFGTLVRGRTALS